MSDETSFSDGSSSKGKWVVICLIVIALFVGFKFLPVGEWSASLGAWIKSIGYWGPAAFIIIYAVATVLLIPASALTVIAGLVFGIGFGSLWVILGANLGASLAFLIGRYLARDRIEQKVEGNEKFQAIDKAVGEQGWKVVALTRLSPVFPFGLQNYAYGLTRVKWIHYALASLIAMIPGTVMYVYIGTLGKVAAESDSTSTAKTILYVVGFIATVVVTVLVTKTAKKALEQQTDVGSD